MKNSTRLVLFALSALLCGPSVFAQTNTTPAVPTGLDAIVQSFSSWITTPDTNNLTLETSQWRAETGPAIQSGLTLSDDALLQYNLHTNGGFGILSLTRNASIGGTIVSQQLGAGYNLYQKYDTEVVPYALVGYRFDNHRFLGSIGADLRHMLNQKMYIAPGIQLDFIKHPTPMGVLSIGIAF